MSLVKKKKKKTKIKIKNKKNGRCDTKLWLALQKPIKREWVKQNTMGSYVWIKQQNRNQSVGGQARAVNKQILQLIKKIKAFKTCESDIKLLTHTINKKQEPRSQVIGTLFKAFSFYYYCC